MQFLQESTDKRFCLGCIQAEGVDAHGPFLDSGVVHVDRRFSISEGATYVQSVRGENGAECHFQKRPAFLVRKVDKTALDRCF